MAEKLIYTTTTINVTGTDAMKFLQGQLTADLNKINNNGTSLTAYCNNKGKIIWLGFIKKIDTENWQLNSNHELNKIFIPVISKYILGSNVAFSLKEATTSHSLTDAIHHRLPILSPIISEMFFPHDLNLEQTTALSFNKGCYKGQEIIARMQHLGNIKRKMFLLSSKIKILDDLSGKIILNSSDLEIGKVIYNTYDLVLAVLNLTSLAEDQDFHVENYSFMI